MSRFIFFVYFDYFVMAFSSAQHFVECSLCLRNVKFYCNTCYNNLCLICRDEHLKRKETTKHECVLYAYRKLDSTNIAVLCENHMHLNCSAFCQDCQTPICDDCVKDKHFEHTIIKDRSKTAFKENRKIVKAGLIANEVSRFSVQGIGFIGHISCLGSEKAWISDWGSLILVNDVGKHLENLEISDCVHAVTQDGHVFLTDRFNKCIKKVKQSTMETQIFTKTGDLRPVSVCYSSQSGNILVGMESSKRAKVVRYDMDGHEIQSIEENKKGKRIFHKPCYITENKVNGDVCVSDLNATNNGAVIVVDNLGRYRFSFFGLSGESFMPSGICTDVLGHILVYECHKHCVLMIDQFGQFLATLLNFPYISLEPQGLCIDDSQRIWCAHQNTVIIYRYTDQCTVV